jgi:hypothetical protein
MKFLKVSWVLGCGVGVVKSLDTGNRSRSDVPANGLEWRRDDEGGPSSVDNVAIQGAAGGGGTRSECGADLPTLRHLPEDVLQVETAVHRLRRGRFVRPSTDAASVAPRDAS